ncbi:SAV_6107 family HEPN domain-containing protein, partial [Pseudokineococcus basanitobsidens]
RRGGVLGVWDVLPRVAPELGEWALLFAAGAPRRAAVEAGRAGAVTARDADDLLRDAETFAGVVSSALGLGAGLGLPRPARPVRPGRPVPPGPAGPVPAAPAGAGAAPAPGS